MECPKWCTATHDDRVMQIHESQVTPAGSALAFTYARQWEHREHGPEAPAIRAFAVKGDTTKGMELDARGARTVAQIVENLSRANAELIDPAPDAEPEAG